MKLSSDLVDRTLSQLPAEAIPETHPAMGQLNRTFGDHTFFLDDDGLLIVEPAGSRDGGASVGEIVKLASWNDEHTSLLPHEPERTDVVIVLEPREPRG